MAIKGITDKPARFFPRIAKIRLGIKRKGQGQTEYPVDVDHFVCPPEVEEVFGKNPKAARAYLTRYCAEVAERAQAEAGKLAEGFGGPRSR